MFRQALSTSSRAVRSTSFRPLAQQPLLRSQLTSPAPLSSIPSRLQPARRWYSDNSDAAKKEAEPKAEAEAKDSKAEEAKPADPDAELKKKLETKEKEAIDWKDKYMRSVADFRNLQERTAREMKNARDFAIQKFAKDLVDSVDNLDRALTMGKDSLKTGEGEAKNTDLESFYEGVKMTETNMLSTLKKHGLELFNPEGDKFNPNEHEATFMTPQPDKEDGSVFFVQQKGFKLNGRILRAAKVGVVKNQ